MKRQVLEKFEFYIRNKIHLLKNTGDSEYEIAVRELDSVLARIEDCIAEDKQKRKNDKLNFEKVL